MIKFRTEEKSNYKSIWNNGKTIRFAINSSMPILELEYPEFYDIKITNNCDGDCPYCYTNSKKDDLHYDNIVQKIIDFFGKMDKNQRPFQVAIGGGEPTSHPDFLKLIETIYNFEICPNYTTNGMFIDKNYKNKIIEYTKRYCGAVALSCHPHLNDHWKKASKELVEKNIKVNFHIIISDEKSINRFMDIYNEWNDKIDYFVLLPQINIGRSKDSVLNWEYLIEKIPSDKSKLAFGANFYPYLKDKDHDIDIVLYEPEIMSKFLDLKDMKIYNSSFNI
jgi:sulfatase maturation enzyme AslB (radical SAM superfamily)